MVELKEKMCLYHGSYCPVDVIDLNLCNPHKDFGRGFYLTSSKEQAQNFVRLSLKRARSRGLVSEEQSYGYVSAFQLISLDGLRVKYFRELDDQVCFTSQASVNALKYVGSEKYGA